MIDDNAVLKVREHIADALARGGQVVTGGDAHALGGRFFQPTIITGIGTDMIVKREETFGPLVPVTRFFHRGRSDPARERHRVRLIKEQTGTSPLQWLLNVRVRKAQELLERTCLPIDRIGTEVGFDVPSHFRERFRRRVGLSPSAYRRSFAAGQSR